MFQQSKRTLAVAVAAVGLALPISGVALAAAQSVDSTTTSTPSAQSSGTPPSDSGATDEQRAARRAQWVGDVAAKLGIPAEQLQGAIDSVRLDRLTERLTARVTAGKMTQAQADAIVAKAKNGEWPAHGAGRHRR